MATASTIRKSDIATKKEPGYRPGEILGHQHGEPEAGHRRDQRASQIQRAAPGYPRQAGPLDRVGGVRRGGCRHRRLGSVEVDGRQRERFGQAGQRVGLAEGVPAGLIGHARRQVIARWLARVGHGLFSLVGRALPHQRIGQHGEAERCPGRVISEHVHE